MSAFEYQALDNNGKQHSGVLEGDTSRQIRQILRKQGLNPFQVEEVSQRETRSDKTISFLRRGISANELALITRQLATLVLSALPLEECLHTVARQTERLRTKNILLTVRSRVMEGYSLADGLGYFPHIFPELYRTTVSAGEQSGHLELVLQHLADYTELRQQIRQKILLAMFYPIILTFVAIFVIAALLTYVVPEVTRVFDNLGQALPWLTIALISVSDFLVLYGIWLLFIFSITLISLHYLLHLPVWRSRAHRILLHMPIVGRIVRVVNTARFARTFSILSASGVAVLDAMRISADVVSNIPMREAVQHAASRVREGSAIGSALEQSGYFPPMTVHLIASGESGGKLDSMLVRAADNLERELETTISVVMGVFEPLLILIMGGVVMLIVLAILLPIFDLNHLVN